MKTILIIGAGNMGGVLARGLCASSYAVAVCDTHATRLNNLTKATGASAVHDLAEYLAKGAKPDAVIFCVKPQDLHVAAAPLVSKLSKDAALVSILAGVTIDDIAAESQHGGSIIRSMPNICSKVGLGATALCHNDQTSEPQKQQVQKLFETIGEADWTKESLLDAVTGLSGSGPAYVYMVIEALTEGGVKMGIPQKLASQLAVQTVYGAAKMVKETGEHPAVLRNQVTTPGGTTIHAIQELEERGLRAMLMRAVEIATKRSADLRK